MIVAELAAKLGLIPDQASWDKGHALIQSLGSALDAYLGYEGLKKVAELVEGTVEAAQSAQHLGEQLGITTDAVQELGYAADATDVGAQTLNAGMERLARGMEQAKTGTGPVHDALGKLHVKMQDLKGESLDQNLEVLADAFAKMPDGAEKAALAMEIFGRSAGPRMLQLMNKGKEGIVELREEAHKMGVVMDEEAIKKADELDESQKKLKATLIGLRNEAVVAILPSLTAMAEGLRDFVMQNREIIVGGLTAVLKGIAFAFSLVADAVHLVTYLYHEHQEILGALIIAFGALAAESVLAAVSAAIAWAAAFLPLIAGAAILALVWLGVKKLMEYITGKSYSMKEMWDSFLEAGNMVLAWLEDLPGEAEQWITKTVDAIRDEFQGMWDDVVKQANHAWDEIKGIPIIGHVIRGAQFALSGSPLDAIKAAQANPAMYSQRPSIGGIGGIGVTPGANGGDYQVSIGDTHIQIDGAGMSPDELKGVVKDSVREAQTDSIRQAFQNLTGGRR